VLSGRCRPIDQSMAIMNNVFKLLIAVILLASVDIVIGDQLSRPANSNYLTSSIQIDQSKEAGNLTSADNHASEEKYS
jgi:hypothetical protein